MNAALYVALCMLCVTLGCGQQASVKDGEKFQTQIDTDGSSSDPAVSNAATDDELESVLNYQKPPDPPSGFDKLLADRKQLDQTVWANEVRSHEYEATLIRLWDDLLAAGRDKKDGDKLAVLAAVPLETITVGKPAPEEKLDWDIQAWRFDKPKKQLDHQGWVALIDWARKQGFRLVQSEWHHATFRPAGDDPPSSTVTLKLHLLQAIEKLRVIIRGKIEVAWSAEKDTNGNPIPRTIDATGLELLTRKGEPAFDQQEMLTIDPATPGRPAGIHPLFTYDLDGDGLSEIIAAGCNRIYRNLGGGKFKQDDLLPLPQRFFEVGVLADFNGDGTADFVAPGIRGDLLTYQGRKDGTFSPQALGNIRGGPLRQPQALTAGDIDGDGDLDLWVGQYAISYVAGTMPSPYYDANDGLPADLLLNDGKGKFTPATEAAGLAKKRNRRTYTAAFVDLDDDKDLDLLVISDFAGVDMYHNDGKGYFTDVTDRQVDEPHLFGMSATLGDYDLDGRLDLYVSGMASTTARRLERLKLGRENRADIHMMRLRMAYGNRMYLRTDKGYKQPAFRDEVARTGWTWGGAALDFDNDGDEDIYVANGHSSGKSTKDHCTHFWCHDIYEASPKPDEHRNKLFQFVHKGYLNRSESWDGYQKNTLLMNGQGKGFSSIAFLLGVAKEYDARAVVADDLDADGRVDLLVVEDRWTEGQILHVYRNQLKTGNHWIGVRLREQGKGLSPIGAEVTVFAGGKKQIRRIVAGASIHSQQANTLHFGLGATTKVDAIEVRWHGGKTRRIEMPKIDQYHTVLAGK